MSERETKRQRAWETERNSLESDRGRGRSEPRPDAKQMLVGSQGEVRLLFMQALTDRRRT